MKRIAGCVAVAAVGSVSLGQVQFFVENPTGNSGDFLSYCAARGLALNTSVDFATHPDGAVIPDFFRGSAGVTLEIDGAAAVLTGDGSLTPNNPDPGDVGEGLLPEPATYLATGSGVIATVDFVFDTPVTVFGLMTADMFQWVEGVPAATIEAFDSDGNSLGAAPSFDRSYEFDFLYFMGVADELGRISRVRFTNFGNSGDSIYLTRAWLSRSCPADFNADGFVTGDDFDAYVAEFELGNPTADFNADGFVTGDDFDLFVAAFEAGC